MQNFTMSRFLCSAKRKKTRVDTSFWNHGGHGKHGRCLGGSYTILRLDLPGDPAFA